MLGITNVSNAPSIVLTNTSVSTWTALPSTGTDSDMKTQGYTYYASIPCNGISANTIAEVTFSEANAKSGNYASTCRTYANEIRVYSKVNTAITIPSIIVHSIVESYYAVDNSPPTSGKTTAITSGAVYTAINTVTTGTVTTASGISPWLPNLQKQGKIVCWTGEYHSNSDVASGTILFTLPSGFRPASNLMTVIVSYNASSENLPLTIDTLGRCTTNHTFKGGNYYYVSVTFMTE